MKKLKCKLSPLAMAQIEAYYTYNLLTFGEKKADFIQDSIFDVIESLQSFPGLGHVEPSLTDYPQCFRTFVQHANLKILYWVEDHIVKIALIFDTRQSPDKLRYIIEHHSSWVCEDVAVPYEKKKTSSRK